MKIFLLALLTFAATATTVVDLTPGEALSLKTLAAKRDAAEEQYHLARKAFDDLSAATAKAHGVHFGYPVTTTSATIAWSSGTGCVYSGSPTEFDKDYKHIVVP